MIDFAICPHDTESEELLNEWIKIKDKIALKINKKINFITFKDYYDELENFDKIATDIYYASPVIAYKLKKLGYIPVAKIKGQFDSFVLVGELNQKEITTVITVNLETHIAPLLYVNEIDFTKTKIKYVNKQKEIIKFINNKKADIGIVYKEVFDKLNPDIKTIKEVNTKMSHFFMVKKESLYLKNAILSLNGVEEVDEEYFKNSFNINFDIDSVFKVKEFYDISKTFYEIPFIGYVIFRDNILYANKNFQEFIGYSLNELKNKKINEITERIYNGFYKCYGKNGIKYAKCFFEKMFFNGNFVEIAVIIDITKEKLLQQKLEESKIRDSLTSLYNLDGFLIKVNLYKKRGMLILIDINNFTFLNKTYGKEIADLLLQKVAEKLKKECSKSFIARVGSDEFAVFRNIDEENEILEILEKIHNCFKNSFKVASKDIKIFVNVGIAAYPEDAENIENLLQNASTALSLAKNEGIGTIKFFNKNMNYYADKIIKSETLIEKALKEDLFIFYLQPYFNAKNLTIAGFESLVRIKEKNIIIYPNEFIDVLENSPFVYEFRKKALKKIKEYITEINMPVSINLSANDLKDKNLLNDIKKAVKNLKKPLTVEITERAIVKDLQNAKKILNSLKGISGITLSMDDFGTGYSSLSSLKDLPFDVIKIDISFVRGMVEDKKMRSVVKNIINLTKDLNLKTVAEGVETKKQLELLQKFGIDYMQGYLLSKPISYEEVKKVLKNDLIN